MKCGLGCRSSKGAALLAIMLVLITGSTWVLLSDLNRHAEVYVRRANSGFALNKAKQALLFYAMNYPELRANPEKGPGFFTLAPTATTTAGRNPIAHRAPEPRWAACLSAFWDSTTRGTAAVNACGMPCRLTSGIPNPTRR